MRDRPLRIDIVCNSQARGGAELFSLELAAGLRERGADARICLPPGASLAGAAIQRRVPTRTLDIGPKLRRGTASELVRRGRGYARVLRAHVDRPEIDVVLLQFKKEQLLWGGAPWGPRVLILEHGRIPRPVTAIPPLARRYRAALRAATLRLAAGPVAEAEIRRLEPELVVDPLEAGLSRRRVELARRAASEAGSELQRRTGMPRVAVTTVQLTPKRGVEQAIDGVAEAATTGLAVLGEGPMMDELRQRAQRRGVAKRVWFAGFVAEPLPYVAAAEASCSLGMLEEGRPLRLVEAVAVGTPVVASGIEAHRQFARQLPDHVEIVDPADPQAVARALEAVAPLPAVSVPAWDDVAGRLLEMLQRR